jgi:hypothetical protein
LIAPLLIQQIVRSICPNSHLIRYRRSGKVRSALRGKCATVFENIAFGIQQSVATLCGLGLGLGGPWVAQAWPKGQPSVTQGRTKRRMTKAFCLQQKLKNAGWGWGLWLKDAGRRLQKWVIGKTKSHHGDAETRRTAKIERSEHLRGRNREKQNLTTEARRHGENRGMQRLILAALNVR